MLAVAGLLFVIAFILLALVPIAWIRHGQQMAANGVITSLMVGAVGVPFYIGGVAF